MDNRIPEIRKRLKKKLGASRYEHSLSVSYTAAALAMRYSYDIDKAELAGLLHDCARQYDTETIYQKCIQLGIPITEDEKKSKILLHAKLGAYMAKEKYHVDNPEILSAITFHTTGKANMSVLDKIIYVADYIEPRRYKADNLEYLRRQAFQDLDLALCGILKGTLAYLSDIGASIDKQSEEAYNYYIQENDV